MMLEIDGVQKFPRELVGGKAFHLNELLAMGLRVPATAVIPATEKPLTGIETLARWLDSKVGPRDVGWPVAIRSSSAFEDSESDSKAGHFLSLLGTFDHRSIASAIEKVQSSGPSMAVVVQPLIRPAFAGVAFSCDPLTYVRNDVVIAWTRGLADRLVAGDDPGTRIITDRLGNLKSGMWPSPDSLLVELVTSINRIENSMNGPVDIEWAIDEDGQLWLVQARRVVLPGFLHVSLNSRAAFDSLPTVVRQHSKIRLRRQAFERGVTMAPAIVECWPSDAAKTNSHGDDELGKPAGVSVVLLHPERVQCQIVREFASVHGSDVEFFARGCRRHCIRRYPKTVGVTPAKHAVLKTGLSTSWLSVAIVQAVWDAAATGIIRRFPENYIIELAQGHFVPKGVVPTSTIVLDRNHNVLSAIWREQPTAYRFIDGHVVTETPPNDEVRFDAGTLGDIAACFDPLFDLYEDAALEFGVVVSKGNCTAYLIDVAESDKARLALDLELINSGVLSVGKCRGRVHRIELSAIGALDKHLHDRPEDAIIGNKEVVIVAERASIELLPFAGASGVVGFVFERGSILAHLAVVLREKGIPAIAIEDEAIFRSLEQDQEIEIDAVQHALAKTERVIRVRSRS